MKNIANLLLVSLYIFLSAGSLIGMRKFLGNHADKGILMYLNPPALLSLFGYGCSFLLWTWIVSRNNLTFIYPLTVGLIFVIVYAGSIILLNEKFTLQNVAGAIFILIGVIIITLK